MTIKDRIKELLPIGECNAVHLSYLADLFQISMRSVKEIIQSMRLDDIKVCSSSCGYYIAKYKKDIGQYKGI